MRRLMWVVVGGLLLVAVGALAQQVIQSGKPIPGHVGKWITNLTLGDAGPANGGPAGTGVTELNVTSTLNNGAPFCINDAPTTGPYHQLCFGANSLGGGLLTYNAFGGAPQQPFNCVVNGIEIPNCLTPLGSVPTGSVVTPQTFGAKCDGTTDDTAALTQALSSGVLVAFTSKCAAASSLNITGCPYISGYGPETSQILFTAPGTGLTVTCNYGSMSLRDVAVVTQQSGGGTGVTVNCGPQQPTFFMDHVTVSGVNPGVGSAYWNNGVVINNCRLIHVYRSYIYGKAGGDYTATAAGLLIENTSGISSVLGEVFDNVIQDVGTAIQVTPSHQSAPGVASIEGLVFRDNALITNNIALKIDASNAGYVPPGFFFVGNQTESWGPQSVYLNNLAQAVIADNVLYNHSTTGDGITLVNVSESTIHDNRIISLAGSTGIGVDMSTGANQLNNSHSNFVSGFGEGHDFSATSNYNAVMPNINQAVGTVLVNHGAANSVVDLLSGGSNEMLFYPNVASPHFLNGFSAYNDMIFQSNVPTPAAPPNLAAGGALTNNFSGGAGEINLWNTSVGAVRSFEIRQETGSSTNIPLFSVDATGGLNVGGVAPAVSGFGSGAVVNASSNDAAGILTTGTGGATGSALITFASAKPTGPACIVVDSTNHALLASVISTTGISIGDTIAAGHQVIWHCFGLTP